MRGRRACPIDKRCGGGRSQAADDIEGDSHDYRENSNAPEARIKVAGDFAQVANNRRRDETTKNAERANCGNAARGCRAG